MFSHCMNYDLSVVLGCLEKGGTSLKPPETEASDTSLGGIPLKDGGQHLFGHYLNHYVFRVFREIIPEFKYFYGMEKSQTVFDWQSKE